MLALLALQGINAFIIPVVFPADSGWAQVCQDILLTLTVLSGFYAVVGRSKVMALLIAISAVALAVHWAAWLYPLALDEASRNVVTVGVLGLIWAAIAAHVFGPGDVTLNRVAGAVVLYVLAGLIFAYLYALAAIHDDHAFAGVTKAALAADRSTWIYFSFVTLTTVGYGDIVPVSHGARALATVEALIGQIYPAVILGRLVSLQVTSITQTPAKRARDYEDAP